jgi:hypothetical protein
MQFLAEGDLVGVSFWIVSVAMIASTVFFLYEGLRSKANGGSRCSSLAW